jgi:hypothetical protein
LIERTPKKSTIDYQIKNANTKPTIEQVSLPFRRDYEIVFHEHEVFKISLHAQSEVLSLLVVSTLSLEMWRGEFKSVYLEEISRKTGREILYI